MNEFTELLVGTFANKRQAQSHPTRYAHIRVSHRLIGGNRIYGEQAYNYLLNRPYRQFVIDVVQEKEEYRLKNYEIINPLQFAECKNIDKITDDMLKYLDELTDILSGAFTIGKDKDVYQIKRRKSGKRDRDSKKS